MNAETLQWASVDDSWKLINLAVQSGVSRLFLSGSPGVGKSHFGAYGFGNRPYYQITLSEDLSVQEMFGHFVPKGQVFEWHDGPCTRAAREGAVLVINEIQRASDAVKDALLGLLDDPSVAMISLPNGENMRPKAGFTVVATSNDPLSSLDPALQDRFEVAVALTAPNPGLVSKLNEALEGLGYAVANSFKDEGREIPPRRAFAFAKLVGQGVDNKQAAVMAFGDRAPDVLNALIAGGVRV